MKANDIQKMLIDKNMNKKTLAEKCGWSPSNLRNKLKRDNFSENELKTIADALDCDLEIDFIPRKAPKNSQQ
ncbi:helix-turn-helix domain-containing protein [Bilifractor sp. LCP19S3_H10]|uniref:helix-turn-helix domain-containing protein n=1 Tax=Bilifractor sp. LCP19S3_H10 TaxID=3438736 RepID=UPI003F936357